MMKTPRAHCQSYPHAHRAGDQAQIHPQTLARPLHLVARPVQIAAVADPRHLLSLPLVVQWHPPEPLPDSAKMVIVVGEAWARQCQEVVQRKTMKAWYSLYMKARQLAA